MFARSTASKPRAVSLVTRYAAPFGRNVGRPAQAELQHHEHLWKERTTQRGNREKWRRPNSVVAHRKKISSEKETRRGSTGHEKKGLLGTRADKGEKVKLKGAQRRLATLDEGTGQGALQTLHTFFLCWYILPI
jgi:hypothetical protein